jgi:hypothetical protein
MPDAASLSPSERDPAKTLLTVSQTTGIEIGRLALIVGQKRSLGIVFYYGLFALGKRGIVD